MKPTFKADLPSKKQLLAKAERPSQEAMRLHPYYRGKVQILPKCPVRGSRISHLVHARRGGAVPGDSRRPGPGLSSTRNKANSIAIVSDGTRVLGLGDIGPEAGLPVMEGKALLFKYLGGVDAVPICLATKDPDEIIRTVKLLEPAFGGINLEDIAQPKCFRILDALRGEMRHPGLARRPAGHGDRRSRRPAQRAEGRRQAVARSEDRPRSAWAPPTSRHTACCGPRRRSGRRRRLRQQGDAASRAADIEAQQDEFPDKWRVCRETNAERRRRRDRCGAARRRRLHRLLRVRARSSAGWVAGMAKDAIVFACANPVPEIWPWEAKAAGARIVATGRGDFPNQVNNSLCFPGIFRGVLDVRARAITDEMAHCRGRGAGKARAASACRRHGCCRPWRTGRSPQGSPPPPRRQPKPRARPAPARCYEEEFHAARAIIDTARRATRLLMDGGAIAPVPAATQLS